ncbi:MAG: LysR substrate-binding domain-containing protein [Paracoccus sp. (in: a-proteobacteria)]|nr:LysR substrate-binding domain-containing protein [Paracoccus sp. (in: a-proteobacteria)]
MAAHITINAVPLIGELVVPAMAHLAGAMPGLRVTYRSELGFARLNDGRTIGIRAGAAPCARSMVVRPLGRIGVALVATQDYIDRMGMPAGPGDLGRHDFASHDFAEGFTPWSRWLLSHVPQPRVLFRSNDETVLRQAIRSGRWAGFLPLSSLIWSTGLIEILPALDEWAVTLWLVHAPDATAECRQAGQMLADIMARQLA